LDILSLRLDELCTEEYNTNRAAFHGLTFFSQTVKTNGFVMGRPREFDLDEALDRALEVFWRKGYEGTSIPDLTEAMGINRPSLYAAFGNKESLFGKVLDRYAEKSGSHVREALNEPTAKGVVEKLLNGTVTLLSNPRQPKGCLLVQGALTCGEEADCIRLELIARRALLQTALRDRFQKAIDEHDLPATSNAADLARFVTTFMHGLAVQAASGAKKAEMLRVVDLFLQACGCCGLSAGQVSLAAIASGS
jgi:AcrR family transcriptional regulator